MVPWYEPPTEPFPLAIHVTAGYHSTCVTFANQKVMENGIYRFWLFFGLFRRAAEKKKKKLLSLLKYYYFQK
jgi:hypothetical protein